MASAHGHLQAVKILVALVADVNVKDKVSAWGVTWICLGVRGDELLYCLEVCGLGFPLIPTMMRAAYFLRAHLLVLKSLGVCH